MSSSSTSKLENPSLSSTPPLEYEQKRDDNIRRNQEFLRSLGITSPIPKRQEKSVKKSNKSADSTLPLRRSTRKRIHSSLSPDEDTPAISPVQTHVEESPLVAYVDSSALQYSCDHSSFKDPSLLPSCGPISGFRLTGKTMRDTRLTKIYSLDVSYLIFGGDMEEQIDQENQQQHEAGAVMSWRGSKSWISGVRFVDDNPMMLVSSSNDGKLIVWDTSKSAVESKSPLIVAESKGLHSNGIFGMDKCGHTIATASKDSSVGIWKMSSSGEVVAERTISGHHKGVVRGVCFGSPHKLADCGADGNIPLESCSQTVKSRHSPGAVNTVEWCCSNEFLLLSSGKDTRLVLYDVRKNSSDSVVHMMEGGHVSDFRSGRGGTNQIYKPAFVDNGMGVATTGHGSNKISLYSVATGKLLSEGWIGYDANMVYCTLTGAGGGNQRLWAAGKQINQFCPI
ncbi:hypothetical protein ZOSMA_265G00220 [Zostera marina]|uniref:Uncharacterized protein n=1 Tax=Zostera marina TaxID=29655 RepID=A0A0K9PEL2_ZOSMR|nr:hypothetical protein ZOSMA_265G00220 [Zostera marina]